MKSYQTKKIAQNNKKCCNTNWVGMKMYLVKLSWNGSISLIFLDEATKVILDEATKVIHRIIIYGVTNLYRYNSLKQFIHHSQSIEEKAIVATWLYKISVNSNVAKS